MNWIGWNNENHDINSFIGYNRQISINNIILTKHNVNYWIIKHLELSKQIEIRNNTNSSINHLVIDRQSYRYLLCGGLDGNISLYDLESYSNNNTNYNIINSISKKKSFKLRSNQTSNSVSNVITNVEWYPNDNGLFLVSQRRGFVQLWDTEMFDVATDCEINSNYINYATFNKIIPLVAIATNDSNIYLYDPNTGDKSHQLCGHKSEVITIDWSPSSPHQLCSGSIDGSIKFWDIRKGNHHGLLLSLDWRQDHTFNHSSNGSSIKQDSNSLRHIRKINWSNDEAAKAHEEAVRNIKYTSCGSYIISSGNDKKIRLWEVSTGKLMPTNYSIGRKSDSMQGMEIMSFDHSSDDLLLFSSGKYGNISIIPVHTNHGEPIHTLTGHVGRVTSMTYRKKYQQVISCGKDGMIHLWECNKTPNIKASTNSLHLNKVINSEDYDNWSDYEAEYDNCNTTSKKSNKSKGISAEVVPKLYAPPILQRLIDDFDYTISSYTNNTNVIINDVNEIPNESITKEDKLFEKEIKLKRKRLSIGINHIKSKYSK